MIPTPIESFDGPAAALVRLSAHITAGSEASVRSALAECGKADVPPGWVEEVVLQSYLFAGFPRALNAAREWRRIAGQDGTAERERMAGESYANVYDWRVRGEETCRAVYGAAYTRLRANIAALHPALDQWMIVEGYGKVLSRSGLDIGRRELCIVAACAAAQQDRQLHSHLLGARNVGVPDGVIGAAIDALAGAIPDHALESARLLWRRVLGKK